MRDCRLEIEGLVQKHDFHRRTKTMSENIQTHIEALHGAWCQSTGQELHLRATERLFFDLHQMEFTPTDIQMVAAHLIGLNKNSGGAKYSLRANRVLGDLEFFASTLAEAKATKRNKRPAPTPKEKVVALRERVVEPEEASTLNHDAPKSFADVLKAIGRG